MTSASRMRRETSMPSSRTRLPSTLRLEAWMRVGSASAQQRLLLVEGEVVLDRLQRERAVHGPRLQVEKAEAPRQMRGERALARAGRAVDGDDGALAFLCRSDCNVIAAALLRLRHPGLFASLRFELACGRSFAEGLLVALEFVEGAGGFSRPLKRILRTVSCRSKLLDFPA